MDNKVLHGIVHGNVIELETNIGMTDGQQVDVVVRPVLPEGRQAGDGLLRTEGALADDKEWDAIMEQLGKLR